MIPPGRDPDTASFEDASAHETPLQADWPDKAAGTPPEKPGPLRFMRELPVLVLIAFGLAMLIKSFLVQAFYIPSESMLPTLERGDRVLVNKLVYRFREPKRGEVVVFVAIVDTTRRGPVQRFLRSLTEGLGAQTPGDKDYIKRVMGLPGDTLEMKDGVLTVTTKDGKTTTLKETYLTDPRDLSPFGPYKVPEGRYFVMGDNRANSSDGRVNTFGGLCPQAPCSIPKSRVVGKAFVTIWPPSRATLHRVPSYALSMIGARSIAAWLGA